MLCKLKLLFVRLKLNFKTNSKNVLTFTTAKKNIHVSGQVLFTT